MNIGSGFSRHFVIELLSLTSSIIKIFGFGSGLTSNEYQPIAKPSTLPAS
jgi:hypothetical protein